jgi:hypothetical protein
MVNHAVCGFSVSRIVFVNKVFHSETDKLCQHVVGGYSKQKISYKPWVNLASLLWYGPKWLSTEYQCSYLPSIAWTSLILCGSRHNIIFVTMLLSKPVLGELIMSGLWSHCNWLQFHWGFHEHIHIKGLSWIHFLSQLKKIDETGTWIQGYICQNLLMICLFFVCVKYTV